MLNLPWQGFFFNCKIEAYAGMAEQLVRYLAIEEALHDEIKDTLEHNNHSYVYWCALSDKEKNNNKVKLTVTYERINKALGGSESTLAGIREKNVY